MHLRTTLRARNGARESRESRSSRQRPHLAWPALVLPHRSQRPHLVRPALACPHRSNWRRKTEVNPHHTPLNTRRSLRQRTMPVRQREYDQETMKLSSSSHHLRLWVECRQRLVRCIKRIDLRRSQYLVPHRHVIERHRARNALSA